MIGPVARRSTRSIDYQDVPRPMAAMADDYPPGFVDPRHSHRRAQLIYATTGVMSVSTRDRGFVVPPQRALWLPGGVEHEVLCRGQVSLRTLYVDRKASLRLPTIPRVIEISPLLRELILEAVRMPVEYDLNGRDGRVMSLIMDEIESMAIAPLSVPMPQERQLVRICHSILENPAEHLTLASWAKAAGMSRRTFTRLFRRETEMSFAEWRQHVRLLEALSRLAVGHAVTTVAFDVGYSSSSAFTAMFRRAFGTTPTDYVDRALAFPRQKPGGSGGIDNIKCT